LEKRELSDSRKFYMEASPVLEFGMVSASVHVCVSSGKRTRLLINQFPNGFSLELTGLVAI
jgi:hypothetical protein